MKVPEQFIPSNPDDLEKGKIVAVFIGRGCNLGIIEFKGKRQSIIRFMHGGEQLVENKRLLIVDDEKQKEMAIRGIEKHFPKVQQ